MIRSRTSLTFNKRKLVKKPEIARSTAFKAWYSTGSAGNTTRSQSGGDTIGKSNGGSAVGNGAAKKALKQLVKQFYLLVHPDLFGKHPAERVVLFCWLTCFRILTQVTQTVQTDSFV